MPKKRCSLHCMSYPKTVMRPTSYDRDGWRWCEECGRVIPPTKRGKARKMCPCCRNPVGHIEQKGGERHNEITQEWIRRSMSPVPREEAS